jgi:hypothetical protein
LAAKLICSAVYGEKLKAPEFGVFELEAAFVRNILEFLVFF